MPRWCPDDRGRFHRRPFYRAEELDAECEALLADFRRATGRGDDVAIETDDLTVLIERHVGDLDMYADLREDGPEVEGVTLFAATRKPDVAIAERLTSDDRRSNRFRTTLAHELGHVILHDPLYQEKLATGDLFAATTEERLGVSEEYELGLIGEPSWTNNLLSRDGERVINGRAPCPVGCTGKKGRPILRCECCSKETLMELLRSERRRGVALKEFWESVRKDKDMVCCRTMIDCPIRDRAAKST